ncbi:DUF1361 domain-containing protein [Enterococcus sp. HY326]|uniref:DUF1361 domain-containing protein n=1 Tax=Enterococcus sp. HY326 TaxID=2971265 RepID=UPI00223FADD9|nr:DUF1361 domain-containing protein [Enterococcus sp. HY326]
MLIAITYDTPFDFLVLNGFLAYIPIEIAFQLPKLKNKWLLLGASAFWLLFFPNIPYLGTDIIHTDLYQLYDNATRVSQENLLGWGQILLLAIVVVAFLSWGFTQMLLLAKFYQERFSLGKYFRPIFVVTICILSALAMYAGRFAPRLHSIYFLTDPLRVLDIIFLTWSLKKIEFIGLFTLYQLVLVSCLLLNRKILQDQGYLANKSNKEER